MKDWIKSLRLPACLFYCLLVIVSFKISGLAAENLWLCISASFFISCATMVQNDWRDQFHDLKKGKNLVSDNTKKYFLLVVAMWIMAFGSAVLLTVYSVKLSVLAWVMIGIGLAYSEIRSIFMLPAILVATTAAGSVLFPVFQDYRSPYVWLLPTAVFIASLAHEIVKDLEDHTIDAGYKSTLPQKIGTKSSEIVTGILMVSALVFMALINPIALAGLPFCAVAHHHLFRKGAYLTAKRYFDGGMIIATLTLLVF